MKLYKKLFLVFIVLFFSACNNQGERSRVVLEFDQSLLAKYGKSQLSALTTTNPNGPNWGLSDPQSLADIDCFGIFVYGPEAGMKESYCTNAQGSTLMKFGPRAGFFKLPGNGEIIVPAGESREIYLLGMASNDGTCESGFAENADIRFSNYSAPFLLGSAKANLTGGENTVKIQLSNQFTSARKLQDCNFIKPDDDDIPDPGISYTPLSVSFYPSQRTVWVDDNVLARTVNFTHYGLSAECSSDGSNYTNCSSSFIWDEAHYNNDHYIRVTHSDSQIEEFVFKPSTVYPGLNFVTCTHNLDGTYGDLDAISANMDSSMFSTENNVICFNDGVTINQGSTIQSLVISSNNITLIVRQGESAEFVNTNISQHGLEIANDAHTNIIGLTVEGGTNGSYKNLYVNGTGTSGSVLIEDSTLQSTLGPALGVQPLGWNVTVKQSNITSTSGMAVYLNNPSTTTIESSNILGLGFSTFVLANNPTLTLNNSTVDHQATGATSYLIKIASGGTVSLSGNSLRDSSGNGVGITSTGTVHLNLDNNTFIRSAVVGNGNNPAINSTNTNNILNSSANGNLFCNENTAVASFTSITNSLESLSGTFNSSAQLNGPSGAITDCP